MELWIIFPSALLFAAVLGTEVQSLKGTSGGAVTLNLGATDLQGDWIVWSYCTTRVPIITAKMTELTKTSDRFQLHPNGSLTIGSLTTTDTGCYECEVYSSPGFIKRFNLIVEAPQWQKIIITYVLIGLTVVFLVGVVVA
ncbi:uncharacterized protein KZ484_023817 isoform 2-T2 [Pholidichthys leucotaenia]